MHSTNNWYVFSDEANLDKNTCDKIKNVAKGKWEQGRTHGIAEGKSIKGGAIDKKVRISDVVWINDQWIYDTIWPYMEEANKQAGWKYDIRAIENMQITRYKKGGYYHFHKDGKGDHLSVYDRPDSKFLHGHVRKLSMTVLLNDNYEGGEFQFARYNYRKEECEIRSLGFNKTGMIVVFPADVEHRVTPVTKGIRYSLVVWFLGPPFK